MTFMKCVIFFQLIALAISSVPKKGGVKIVTSGITPCKMESATKFDFKKDKFDFDFDLPNGLDDKMKVDFNIETGGEGKWASLGKGGGEACKLINQYLQPLIKRSSSAFEPNLPTKCPWKKGTYKVKDFSANFKDEDFNVPTPPPGLVKLTLSIKEKNKVLFCAVVNANIMSG